jgi:hypothetical protein
MRFYKRKKNGHIINCNDALIWFQMVSTAYNDALISYIDTKIASNHAEVCIMMQNNILKDFFTTGRESSYSFWDEWNTIIKSYYSA